MQRVLAGMLTPSSNTTLEPVATAMLGEIPEASVHFCRFRVTEIAQMVRKVAATKPQAITIFCTNLRGAPLVPALEAELGIPIYDTNATVVWKALRLTGVDTRRVRSWGSLFTEVT